MTLRAFDFWSGFVLGVMVCAVPITWGMGKPVHAVFFALTGVAAFAISFWRFEIFRQ